MKYEVTAIRKRPRNFKGLIGQDFVALTLMNALKSGQIAHAYLFSGARGVGKTSTARILARALNCPDEKNMGSDTCFDYSGAEDISRGIALDVIEIDGASNTSVNDIRAIRDEILFPPQNSRYKIYIIDEVHMLSNSAFNALLKTIEEPPQYIIFIFATTEIHKVPATIRSRCQQFNFRLIPPEDIISLLKEACADAVPPVEADDDALFWIAREAAGSMRDAYTLLDQVSSFSETKITLAKIRDKLNLPGIDEINTLTEYIINEDQAGSMEYLDSILAGGTTVEQMIIDLSDYFRSILFIQQGIRREGLLWHPLSTFPENVIQAFTTTQLEKILELLLQAYRDIRYTLNDRLELELLISRLGKIRHYFEPAEIITKIKHLRESILSISGSEHTGAIPSNNPDPSASAAPPPAPARPAPSAAAAARAPTAPAAAIPPAPSSPTTGSTITRDMWEQLVETVQSESPSLASILKGCRHWKHEDTSLKIELDNDMQLGILTQNTELISKTIKKLYNITVSIDLSIQKIPKTKVSEDTRIEKIKEIFNGEIIQ